MLVDNIIFLQSESEEKTHAFKLLDDEGPAAVIAYLSQWHYPREHETCEDLSRGKSDDTYQDEHGYILTWNKAIDYIGLEHISPSL